MKKLLLFLIILFAAYDANAADRYCVSGGTGNWSSTTNWSTSDGGTSGASAPGSSDNAHFTNTTVTLGPCTSMTVDVSARTVIDLDMTNFLGTLTLNNNLTFTGNLTVCSGACTYAGASTLIMGGTSKSITCNSHTLTVPFSFNTITAATLADSCTSSSLVTIGGASTTNVIGGNTFTTSGGLTIASTTQTQSGTTNFKLTGGTWTNASTTGSFRNNVELAGNVTISGAHVYIVGTLTYTSGTITTTGASFTSNSATTYTLNAAGLTIPTMNTNANLVFNGTEGCTFGEFHITNGAPSITFQSTETYTFTTALLAIGTSAASHASFVASTGSSAVNFVVTGAAVALGHMTLTDISVGAAAPACGYDLTLTRVANITTGTSFGCATSGGNIVGQ